MKTKRILSNSFPFLFAIYPILALRSQNLVYVNFTSIVRSLLLNCLFTAIFFLIFKLVFREWDKAALTTTLTVVLFFSYGHIYIQLQTLLDGAIRHRYPIILFGIAFILGCVYLWRLQNTQTIRHFLTIVSVILLGFSLTQAVIYDFSEYQAIVMTRKKVQEQLDLTDPASRQDLPDIYLIILDGYTRSDVLRDVYGYNNANFTQALENIGFYVADCSQSNYPTTKYSLSSLMNADYLQNFSDIKTLPPLNDSFVNATLQDLGYTTIAFENSVRGHFDLMEDITISRKQQALGMIDLIGGPNEFEAELFQTTLLKLIYDMPHLIPGFTPADLQKTEHYEHYRQTLFILDELENIPQMEGRNFVLAHILVPHPPYIFTPSGEFRYTENVLQGYSDNVEFINTHLLTVLKTIITTSEIPPIIIVQGDHGPFGNFVTPEMRLSILNAYYVNAETKTSLYDEITPVNSFRIIFNHYLDVALPQLADVSYYMHEPGEFVPENIVENTCTPP